MPSNNLSDWLILHHALGQSEQLCFKLLKHFKNPTTIVNQSSDALKQLGMKAQHIKRLHNVDPVNIQESLQWQAQPNHHIIPYDHPLYPKQLKQIYSSPLLLYIIGNPHLLNRSQISMVGSRNPSHYGREVAFEFAAALVQQGFTITSGMALGIDAASHQGALHAGGSTVAVLGSGLKQIYPRSNQPIADQIAETGAIVSEFPLNAAPTTKSFPRRNRIISGLSLGLVVVEASLRSGSLISARFALEQDREVFAVPGSIHNPLSKGCHHLIQQGAKPIEKIEDILSELIYSQNNVHFEVESQSQSRYREHLNRKMTKLLKCIDAEDTSVEKIINRSGFDAQTATAMLLNLELHGYIVSSSNGYRRTKNE